MRSRSPLVKGKPPLTTRAGRLPASRTEPKSRFDQLVGLAARTPEDRIVMLVRHHLCAVAKLLYSLPDEYLILEHGAHEVADDLLKSNAVGWIDSEVDFLLGKIFEEGSHAAREVAHA